MNNQLTDLSSYIDSDRVFCVSFQYLDMSDGFVNGQPDGKLCKYASDHNVTIVDEQTVKGRVRDILSFLNTDIEHIEGAALNDYSNINEMGFARSCYGAYSGYCEELALIELRKLAELVLFLEHQVAYDPDSYHEQEREYTHEEQVQQMVQYLREQLQD